MHGDFSSISGIIDVAHDLLCSGLLVVLVIFMMRAHNENIARLRGIQRSLANLHKHAEQEAA